MKNILISSIAIITLFSCGNSWDGSKNGRRFKLQNICVRSHNESRMRTQPIGKSFITIPYNEEVCDQYIIDTIWETFKQEEK